MKKKSLERLIEECGDHFCALERGIAPIDATWTANGWPVEIGFCGQGETPAEAAENLLLIIHQKNG